MIVDVANTKIGLRKERGTKQFTMKKQVKNENLNRRRKPSKRLSSTSVMELPEVTENDRNNI